MADIVDRVRKLLALAGSSNVHEAAAAAARAQELITRHRLESLRLGAPDPDPITDGAAEPLEVARRLRRWRVVLATELARVNGCSAYTVSHGWEERILVAGRAADRAAVAAMWAWLLVRVEWLSAAAGPGRSRKWHEAFRVGAVEAVAERLLASDEETRAAFPPDALVHIVPALAERERAVERFVTEELRLGPGRGMRMDARAYERGVAAGRELPLPPRR